MTNDQISDDAPIGRVHAALFHDHETPSDEPLRDVTDLVQSDEGALLLDRLVGTANALYLGAERTFEDVELRGEPSRQPARQLAWEFWNGHGWGPLDAEGGSDEAARDRDRAVFRWTAPSEWQLLGHHQGADLLPAADPQYWVRVHLAEDPVPARAGARVPRFALGALALVAAVVVVIASRCARGHSR